jgi:UDP-N-acetylglucosamine 2-epimerase (non-hydrolysing)
MKIAPIFVALAEETEIEQQLVHTGQHYSFELKEALLTELGLPWPNVELDAGSGSHGTQTARALQQLEETFVDLAPDLVVVAGDVNSTLAGALAAVKLEIPVCHVESGLRSFDWTMPEEHNRRLTDHVSSLLLTHSASANENLAAEGVATDRVAFVGNTMIDTLLGHVDRARERGTWRAFGLERDGYALVTFHRPALVDSPELLAKALDALDQLGRTLPVLFAMHPRTEGHVSELGFTPSRDLILTGALSYDEFVSLELSAACVITDSGGIQEETTALGIPCFTLRDNTERPVTTTHGTNTLLGLNPARIAEIPKLLATPRQHQQPPLWDGRAGERAAAVIVDFVSVRTPRFATTR